MSSRWGEIQFKHYLAFYAVLLWFPLLWQWWQFPGGWISFQLKVIKTQCFICCYSCYDPAVKCSTYVSTINQSLQVFMRLSCLPCISLCVAACCCCYLGAVGMYQHCMFLELDFSFNRSWSTSMLIIFQIVSPICRMFVPFKHSIMSKGFFSVWLLDHLKISPVDLLNFWQSSTFSHCSNCDIIHFFCSQTSTIHNSVSLPEDTAYECVQVLLAGWEKNAHGTIILLYSLSYKFVSFCKNP